MHKTGIAMEMAKELVSGGAGVNVSNPDLRTPLMLAHGATAGLKDKDGDTAESFARQNRHTAVAELLAQGNSSER